MKITTTLSKPKTITKTIAYWSHNWLQPRQVSRLWRVRVFIINKIKMMTIIIITARKTKSFITMRIAPPGIPITIIEKISIKIKSLTTKSLQNNNTKNSNIKIQTPNKHNINHNNINNKSHTSPTNYIEHNKNIRNKKNTIYCSMKKSISYKFSIINNCNKWKIKFYSNNSKWSKRIIIPYILVMLLLWARFLTIPMLFVHNCSVHKRLLRYCKGC